MIPTEPASRLSKGALVGILLASIAGALILSAAITGFILRRCPGNRVLSNKRPCKLHRYLNFEILIYQSYIKIPEN